MFDLVYLRSSMVQKGSKRLPWVAVYMWVGAGVIVQVG